MTIHGHHGKKMTLFPQVEQQNKQNNTVIVRSVKTVLATLHSLADWERVGARISIFRIPANRPSCPSDAFGLGKRVHRQ